MEKTPKNGFKQNILSPEVIIAKTLYSITLNPSNDRQGWNSCKTSKERIEWVSACMQILMAKIPNIQLDLYMEVSRTGRLHFHGTISFNSNDEIRLFFVEYIQSWLQLMHIDIDTIEDPEKWYTYCTKCKHLIDVHITTKGVLESQGKLIKLKGLAVKHMEYF